MVNRILLSLIVLFLLSCGKKDSDGDDPIPFVAVDRYYNVTMPGFIVLNNPGGWVIDSSAGVKGLFIIRNFQNEFKCFDLNCSYHPLDACSKLSIDSSGLFLKCGHYSSGTWVPCCGSRFGIDGIPTQPPAKRILRQYQTSFDGAVLRVYN